MSEPVEAHDDEQAPEAAEPTAEELEREAERELRKRVALAQIRQYGDAVLRLRAHEVEAFDEELPRLAERMTGLMHDAEGVGLAATQIGILRRFFVFHHDGEDRFLVNPAIVSRSDETDVDTEGCLSLGPVRVPVERPTAVTLEARDESGGELTLDLEGYPARVVQHELDHLDGVLIIDRTDPASRREALAQLRPRLVFSR